MHAALIAVWLAAGTFVAPQTAPAQTRAERTVNTRVTVVVPHTDAELKVNGVPMTKTGAVRTLDLPTPRDAKDFTFEVSWRPNSYTVEFRKAVVPIVKPGSPLNVDLTVPMPGDRAEVIYVPTPPDIVSEMVKLAAVKPTDVVFELGCGDARILIATVKEGGAARGVGVDLSHERVTESTENVKKAGLSEKIEIREGDIFDDKVTAGLENATLVMLYMSDELNLMLRPKLQRLLKKGARIVSHRFIMGDWTPDRTENVTGEDSSPYKLHLWTIK
jgi:precorrin-6B methylase 2